MSSVQFASPVGLLLLLFVPLFLYWNRRLRGLSPGRRRTIVALRSLLFALLVLAAAEIQWVWVSNQLGVVFVLDESDSVPQDQREMARRFVLDALSAMKPAQDRAALVVFGRRPSLEEKLGDLLPAEQLTIRSVPGGDHSNLAAAVRLALAALAPGIQRRLVVLSDGNETMGSVAEAAKSAGANNVVIDVVPLRYQHTREVRLEKIDLPSRLSLGEPFDLRVIVDAEQDGPAAVRLFESGTPIAEATGVMLKGGEKRAVTFRVNPRESGFRTYEAQIEAPDDANPANNRGYGFAYVAGEPKVLLVSANPDNDAKLGAALLAEQLAVEVTNPAGVPGSVATLQNYDAVILSNVHAEHLTRDQMTLLERGVHDLGIGLIMVGGPDTFGAGGFIDTPVEQAMPVKMDVTHKKVIPSGALAIVLHTCEIPNGNYWAREIAVAALNVLSRKDFIGMLDYDYQAGEQWIFPLQRAERKGYLRQLIYAAQPGDMPSFDGTLRMAVEGMESLPASVKRIVIISDGDPMRPARGLVDRARDLGISISTVCIAPHSPRDTEVMEGLAEYTGGNYYFVANANNLPRIFIKEASVVRRSLVVEENFVPEQRQYTEPVAGLFGEPFPQLRGYVATTQKPLADMPLATPKQDPLLAHWRYGLGKTVAFTSDAGARWAPEWLPWDGYVKFWAQLVRWSLRSTSNRNFQITTTIDGTRGRVAVDALDDDGNFMNLLELEGTVIAPSLASVPIRFRQTGPGRYEAEFDAEESGSYLVSINPDSEAEGGVLTSGVSVAYSPEYASTRANESILLELAQLTGGRELSAAQFTRVFDHDLPRGRQLDPLWPLLLWLALLLLPLDIFVRRVMLSPREMAEGVRWVWEQVGARLLPVRRPAEQDATLSALLETKRQVRSTVPRAEGQLPASVLADMERAGGEAPLSASTPAPARPEPEGGPAAGAQEGAPRREDESHTSALLKAKERARQRTRRPGGAAGDKKDDAPRP